ncbi:peptidase [Streptomyces dangxiongensis]|uniref:Peptidase n=1 Tax=Streptomyces dangxiongensis TaxID=1442032 RepID=A0A3G2JR88_9ACTN|nr:Clp protease N-terminal domain-containing protein [Streptomyces dangxiongensis]AYN43949.1 peptidase [Streptomyces dangxiongensis]
MVTGARRRALRDGDRQTDTAHLLHSLLEHDPEARAAVGGPARLARLLGYLVQRSIGYGLRWQGSVEDSGPITVVPAPADPAHLADPTAPARTADPGDPEDPADGEDAASGEGPVASAGPAGHDGGAREAGGWSPAASAALADARGRARRRGALQVTGTDLLAALVTDPGSRAVEVLARAGISASELVARAGTDADERADDGRTAP